MENLSVILTVSGRVAYARLMRGRVAYDSEWPSGLCVAQWLIQSSSSD